MRKVLLGSAMMFVAFAFTAAMPLEAQGRGAGMRATTMHGGAPGPGRAGVALGIVRGGPGAGGWSGSDWRPGGTGWRGHGIPIGGLPYGGAAHGGGHGGHGGWGSGGGDWNGGAPGGDGPGGGPGGGGPDGGAPGGGGGGWGSDGSNGVAWNDGGRGDGQRGRGDRGAQGYSEGIGIGERWASADERGHARSDGERPAGAAWRNPCRAFWWDGWSWRC
jgi:hypothetical protein